jgi:hypothetical protein
LVNVQIDEDVRKLIDRLPGPAKEVVIMRTYLGMSFKEIAEHTEVSINTALGRMRYALINMRKLIQTASDGAGKGLTLSARDPAPGTPARKPAFVFPSGPFHAICIGKRRCWAKPPAWHTLPLEDPPVTAR